MKKILQHNLYKTIPVIALFCLTCLTGLCSCNNNGIDSIRKNNSDSIKTTVVRINFSDQPVAIDPMIYGQMLEDCNDHVIYDGIVNVDGSERTHVTDLLKPLQIPIVRWPAGTFIHEYHWENGIGPLEKRPVVKNFAWKGEETHLFGTDEFLAWCKKLNTVPYINFNMGNIPPYGGTLQEALNWVEYVNGSIQTPYGKKRAQNGYPEPYGVKFWCIGNENYGPWGRHTKESAEVYSKKLSEWAGSIRYKNPDLKLLAVGHSYNWNDTVLQNAGRFIDFLTQHYYITSKVKDGMLLNPEISLFAPAMVEAHLEKIGELITKINSSLGRMDRPIRLSIDEWNNRHLVLEGANYKFTRNDPRRQFDVAIAAEMLNIFIRQSPIVGMANYIFPVNGHGLVKTIGDGDAFATPVYYVFKQYRNWMVGTKLHAEVNGPGLSTTNIIPTLEGDANEIKLGAQTLNYIDVSAIITPKGEINIAFVNRSASVHQCVKLELPANYIPTRRWELSSPDINAANTPDDRNKITPKITDIKSSKKESNLVIPPCGLTIIQCSKNL